VYVCPEVFVAFSSFKYKIFTTLMSLLTCLKLRGQIIVSFFFNHKERKHKSAPTSIYFVNNLLFSSHTFCLYENTFSIYASILLFYIKINPCPFQVKTTHKGGAAFFLSHVAARCTARYTISIRQGGEHCVVISSRCGISTEQ